jgi:hypothetical protein
MKMMAYIYNGKRNTTSIPDDMCINRGNESDKKVLNVYFASLQILKYFWLKREQSEIQTSGQIKTNSYKCMCYNTYKLPGIIWWYYNCWKIHEHEQCYLE